MNSTLFIGLTSWFSATTTAPGTHTHHNTYQGARETGFNTDLHQQRLNSSVMPMTVFPGSAVLDVKADMVNNYTEWASTAQILEATMGATGVLETGPEIDPHQDVRCNASMIRTLTHPGLEVLDVTARTVNNFTEWANIAYMYQDFKEGTAIDFCDVTVSYTHPGTDDRINVFIWLPLSDWNERLLAQVSSGLAGGLPGAALIAGVAAGYAQASTDYGYEEHWASAERRTLKSPGDIGSYLPHGLVDDADVATDDMTAISKQVIEIFYGKAPRYSYWNGCSDGGLRGLIQAHNYPKNYDGILVSSPPLGWGAGYHVIAMHWAHVQMAKLGYVPQPCEMTFIHDAVMEACDGLDGIRDGIISIPELCKFDASDLVGRDACAGMHKITEEAAQIANAAWDGPYWRGNKVSDGIGRDVPFGTEDKDMIDHAGHAQTWCDEGVHGKNCWSVPFFVSAQLIWYLLEKDQGHDLPITSLPTLTEKELFRTMNKNLFSMRRTPPGFNLSWGPLSDLRDFRAGGGKMILWHGLADPLWQVNHTIQYYNRALKMTARACAPAIDFLRLYTPPGVYHCGGGPGHLPASAFDALVEWVEEKKAPDALEGIIPSTGATRPICPYPQFVLYTGGDQAKASSYECVGEKNVEIVEPTLKVDKEEFLQYKAPPTSPQTSFPPFTARKTFPTFRTRRDEL